MTSTVTALILLGLLEQLVLFQQEGPLQTLKKKDSQTLEKVVHLRDIHHRHFSYRLGSSVVPQGCRGYLTPWCKIRRHQHQLELRVVHLVIQFFLVVLRYFHVFIHSDNIVLASYTIHHGGSLHLAQNLLRWAYPWLASLRTTHLLGMYKADLLRQDALANDWSHHFL